MKPKKLRGLELATGTIPTKIKGYDILYTDLYKTSSIKKIVDCEKKLPFRNNKFDLIICNNYLEHTKNFHKLINEIHRILKLNGMFICSMPHFASSIRHYEPSHIRAGHSRIFNSYVEKVKYKSMLGQSQNRKFELVKFDYCINFGKILKPIINLIGFQFYEYYFARVMPFNIDMIFFILKKLDK